MNRFIIILLLILLITSCDKKVIFEKNITLNNQEWPRDSIKKIVFTIDDTINPVNIFFHCRISGNYPNSNMFLFITIEGPDSLYVRDTLECILADDHGKWLGKGFGGLWSNKIAYKQNVIFPHKGNYSVQLDQATRHIILPAVNDIGISIEKPNP